MEPIDDLLKDSGDESDTKSIRGSPPKPEMKHKQGKDKKDQLHKRMENKRDFEKRFKGRSEKSQRQEEKDRSWKKFISREMTRAGKEENKREHERVVKGRH